MWVETTGGIQWLRSMVASWLCVQLKKCQTTWVIWTSWCLMTAKVANLAIHFYLMSTWSNLRWHRKELFDIRLRISNGYKSLINHTSRRICFYYTIFSYVYNITCIVEACMDILKNSFNLLKKWSELFKKWIALAWFIWIKYQEPAMKEKVLCL